MTDPRPPLGPKEFAALARLIRDASGVNLGDEKRDLLASRLRPLVRELGLQTFGRLYRAALDDGETRARVVDRATTSTTGFFRHAQQLDVLARFVGELAPERRVRVWCAGCASGEEAYSVAFVLLDRGARDARVLATDLSRRALARARDAIYTAENVAAIPERCRRFVEPHDGAWRVVDEARAIVTLRHHDVRAQTLAARERFDAVLCRNVLIYFDAEDRARTIERVIAAVRPGGLLLLGPSETGLGVPSGLARIGPATYKKD